MGEVEARERAADLLAAMTFEEKVAVGLGDFEVVAHLGVPPLRYTDGPNGIRGPDNVTAFPASLALAATFDEGLAAAYGAAVAEEARDTGSNVLLGPAVDIARVPLGGRLPEALGEDPYLAGRLAVAEVRAIQASHVVAMVKHFVGNNAETGRTGYATRDGRTPAINTGLRGPRFQARRARPGRGRQRRARHPRAGRDRGTDRRRLRLRPHPGRAAGRDRSADPVRDLRRRPRPASGPGRGAAARPGQHPRARRPGDPDRQRRDGPADQPRSPAAAGRRPGRLAGRDRHRPRRRPAGDGRLPVRAGVARPAGHAPGGDHRPGRGRGAGGVRPGLLRRRRAPAGPDRGAHPAGWGGDRPAGGVLERRGPRRRPGAGRRRPDRGRLPGPRRPGRRGLVGPLDGDDHPHRGRAAPLHRPGRRHHPAGDRRDRGRRRGARVRPGVRRAAAARLRGGGPARRPAGRHPARLLQRHRVAGARPRGRRRQRPAGLAAPGHPHPGGRAAGRRLRRGRGGRQPRPGRGDGPGLARPARRPGPVDRRRGRRQPLRGGRPQHRRAGPDALAGPGRGGGAGMAPRPAVRRGAGRGRVRRRGCGRPAAGHLPGHPRPGPHHRPRALAGRGRRRPLRRGRSGRLPLVRPARPGAAVLFRPRPVVRRVRVLPAPLVLAEATGTVTVSLQVTNVGDRSGAEVVQLCLAAPAIARQPPRQLKGFAKLHLEPGATREVSLRLERDDLAAFDEASGEWVVHPGRYEVLVGRSSSDLRGRAGFEVGVRAPAPR